MSDAAPPVAAEGKGTFGTAELVRRIESFGLRWRITHCRLILPQLGARGVAGHQVKELTGLQVVYGPVRARDIKRFRCAYSSGCK